jgi:hypothetical protein
MRVYDNSLTPDKPLQPDFKVSTIEYQVENGQNSDLVIQMNTFGKPKMNDRVCFSLYDRHINY